jgi:hypothetical protein
VRDRIVETIDDLRAKLVMVEKSNQEQAIEVEELEAQLAAAEAEAELAEDLRRQEADRVGELAISLAAAEQAIEEDDRDFQKALTRLVAERDAAVALADSLAGWLNRVDLSWLSEEDERDANAALAEWEEMHRVSAQPALADRLAEALRDYKDKHPCREIELGCVTGMQALRALAAWEAPRK